jgi:hypothetical protein
LSSVSVLFEIIKIEEDLHNSVVTSERVLFCNHSSIQAAKCKASSPLMLYRRPKLITVLVCTFHYPTISLHKLHRNAIVTSPYSSKWIIPKKIPLQKLCIQSLPSQGRCSFHVSLLNWCPHNANSSLSSPKFRKSSLNSSTFCPDIFVFRQL